MSRKSGLGKGLDALIPSTPEDSEIPAIGINQVPVEQIIPTGSSRVQNSMTTS